MGLCYLDRQLRYVNINEWLAALNGLSVEEHLGRSISELFPEIAREVEAQLFHVLETGEPLLEGVVSAETPSQPNILKYVQYNFLAVRDEDDSIVGVSCTAIEITEQKHAEMLLQNSQDEMEHRIAARTHELEVANAQLVSEVKERKAAEQSLKSDQRKLQFSLNATGTSCWEINLKTDELTTQRPTTTWMGYEPAEVPKSREAWKSLIHSEDIDIPNNKFLDHLEGRAPIYVCEYRVRGKSGEWYWILDRGILVQRDTDGSPLLAVGTATDITKQKQATEALHKNQQFLKSITDSDTQLVSVYDLSEQRNIYANPSLAKFLGRPIQEISTCPGSNFRQQVHPDDLEIYDSHNRRVGKATDVKVLSGELRLKNHTGEYRWLSVRDVVLERDSTGPLQILRTAVDITEHKRAESLLKGEKKILEVVSSSSSQDGGLTELVKFIETQSDGMICSILLLDEEGLHLHHGASISLPDEYNRAINGMEIGPGEGSCGTAAYLNQTVIVSDIAKDSLWTNYRDFAMKHDLRACWSLPIQSSTGSVLGTFAMYYSKPRSPDAYHEMLIERAVHLASIAIERKNAEDKLTQSEQKLQRAQQITHVGSYEVKPDGSPMNWSDECYRIFGLEPKRQLPSRNRMLNEIIHPDDRDIAERTFRKSLVERTPFSYEYRVVRLDGSIHWVHSRVEPILDDTGKIVLFEGTILDITERKITEAALRESEYRLRLVADSLPALISYLGVDRCYEFVNKYYEITFGLEQDQIVGKPVWDILGEENYELIKPHIDSVLAGNSVKYETVIPLDHLGKHTLSVEHVPDRGPDGTVRGFYTLAVDITDRKKIEDELNSIFDLSLDLICVADIERATFVKVNPSFLRLLGYSEDEVMGRTFLDFIHPDDVAATLQVIEEDLKQGKKVLRFENRYRTKEGEYRFLDWSFNPNLDSGLAYSIAHDITERRYEEAQAWKQRNELAHMSRISTMGEMATGIAHELNQPLMAIAGYSFAANRMVEQSKITPLEIQEILSKLEDQAIRAGDIVRQLRNFVKKTESVRMSIDLNMLIQDVAIFVEPDSRQSETKVTFQFFEPSPNVLVDEIQIQQVLVNLIRNAIDAMQETPTREREVKVSTHILQDAYAEITVCDSGIGLSNEEFEQVFHAFFSTKQEGMGMGLPISRSIVEAHGGNLFAERNHGPGMTFKFTLPLEDCHG